MRLDNRGSKIRNYRDERGRFMRVIYAYEDYIGYAYFDGVTLGNTIWQHEYLFRRRDITPVSVDRWKRYDREIKR